jgi:hypothetical protein
MRATYSAPHPPWLDHSNYTYLAKNTSYEAPHYGVFFNLVSLHPSSIHVISSAAFSQTHSIINLFDVIQVWATDNFIKYPTNIQKVIQRVRGFRNIKQRGFKTISSIYINMYIHF